MMSVQEALQHAVRHFQAGDPAEAQRYISIVRAQDPTNAAANKVEGVIAYVMGDHAKAVKLLQAYLTQYPNDVGAWGHLGSAEYAFGRYDAAVAVFNVALKLQSDSAAIHTSLGNSLFARGDTLAAIESYRQALRLQPDAPDAAEMMGRALLQAGTVLAVADAVKQAAAGDPFAMANSVAMASAGEFDDAMAIADAAIAANPGRGVIAAWREGIATRPYFPLVQGAHAPERQVYMSACVGLLGAGDRAISILEVGTYMGASMITWARAIERLGSGRGEIVCIDAWDDADVGQYSGAVGAPLKQGFAHRVFRNARKFVPDGIAVTEHRGLSSDVLPTLRGRTFDIVYLDGCHLHPEVLQDITESHELLRVGGLMCGDDLELQLHDADRAFAEANARQDFIADPASGTAFHPGVTLGVGTFFGAASVFGGFWVMRKTPDGYRPVEMRGTGIVPAHWPDHLQAKAKAAVLAAGLLTEVI